MSDKITTPISNVQPTEDVIDRIVAAERLNQRHRVDQYRQQLLNQMQRNSKEKQMSRIGATQDVQLMYENVKKGEELEKKSNRHRLNVERELQQVNKMLIERKKQSTQPETSFNKDLSEQLAEKNQQVKDNRRQRQQIQHQMNSMQQQIKRQNEMRESSERLYEERQYLQKMEEFQAKREKDRLERLQKHEQNMYLYDKIGKLQEIQQQQQDNLQQKFQKANERQLREGQQHRIQQEKKRKMEQTWLREVQRQIQEKKREKIVQKQQQKKQKELMDRLSNMPAQHKDYQYLKTLERQMQEEKARKERERQERYEKWKEVPTQLSPALLGKIPVGWERQKQMDYIDKKMGFSSYQNSPRGITTREQMELRYLQEKLKTSRQYNQVRQASRKSESPGSQLSQRREANKRYSMDVGQQNATITQSGLQQPVQPKQYQVNRAQAQDAPPLKQYQLAQPQLNNQSTISQQSPRPIRVYDFITGHQRLFNVT